MEAWLQAAQPFDFPWVRSSWLAGGGYRFPGPFSSSVSRVLEGNGGDVPTAAAVILEAETSSFTAGRACGKPHCPLRTGLRRPAVGQPDWPRLAKVIWACLCGCSWTRDTCESVDCVRKAVLPVEGPRPSTGGLSRTEGGALHLPVLSRDPVTSCSGTRAGRCHLRTWVPAGRQRVLGPSVLIIAGATSCSKPVGSGSVEPDPRGPHVRFHARESHNLLCWTPGHRPEKPLGAGSL